MNNAERARYARHIGLAHMGEDGQKMLRSAHAMIVGIGGLGSPAAMYLAASGIGSLSLCDYDRVDLSNLQRQILHTTDDIGELKTHSARASLESINPHVNLHSVDYLAEEDELSKLARSADIILDCTDNFDSRFGLNRVSRSTSTPLITAAAIRWEGQITAFDPRVADSPCYQCLYPDDKLQDTSCEMEGVVAPLVGVMGTLQAQAAINCLLGNNSLLGKVLLYDARAMDWHHIALTRNPKCPLCAYSNDE